MKQILTSFDVETFGLDVYHKKIEIYSYCIGYIKDNKINVLIKFYKGKDKDFLHKYLMNPNYIKIVHNYKYELSVLLTNNIPFHPETLWHDTMIEHQMLFNNSHSHALDSIAFDFFGYTRELDFKFKKYMKAGYKVNEIPSDFLYKYQHADGVRPLLMHYLLFPKICQDKKLLKCYYEEIENVKFTQFEEQEGLMLHKENLKKMHFKLNKALNKLKKYYISNINLNSPDQLSQLLYKEMEIKPIRFTAKGKPSTDKYTVMELLKQNNIPQLAGIIKNRSYSTALTNIEKWLNLQDEKGKIHSNLGSNMARTGRKTSTKPNLYNINKKKALMNLFAVPLRKCFRPKPDYILLPVDQAQIELRLIIDASNEFELIDLLKKDPNADMHHLTVECFSMKKIFKYKNDFIFKEGLQIAQDLLNNNKEQYKTMRSAYKNTGFAIGYGAGLLKLTIILGKPSNELYVGFHNFVKRLPNIAAFSKNTIKEVKETGGVMTSFGRFLKVDPSQSYAGGNYKIQGTAAQILKYGQNKLLKYFKKNKLLKWIHVNFDLYDENIFQVEKSLFLSNEFTEIQKTCSYFMENFDEIKIPLKTEWSICIDNWNDKVDLDLQEREKYFEGKMEKN